MADRIETSSQLARLVGRHPSQVCRWLRRDDWPIRRRPPWRRRDVASVRVWMEETLDDRRGGAADPAAVELLARTYPELDDAQYRRELGAWLRDFTGDVPLPDELSARERKREAVTRCVSIAR